VAVRPNWSPDGRSLLFTTYRTVWLIGADGSDRRQVSLGSAPSFAPDGRHYAYLRGPSYRKDIRRARLDGSDNRLLRRGRSPLWSPNGRTIAYVNRKGIWIMNARTGERLRRVASPGLLPVDWTPDGRRLLCLRYWEEYVGDVQNADLYTVRADGAGSPQRLTRTRRRSEGHAAWSPDGRQIVFAALTAPREFQQQRSIWTMSAHGTREKRIWQEPAFSEDDEDRVTQSPVSLSWQPLTD
jgi:Tol biopolymer transport system component